MPSMALESIRMAPCWVAQFSSQSRDLGTQRGHLACSEPSLREAATPEGAPPAQSP